MGLFSKKDHVSLEEMVQTIVLTAFEFPFREQINRVQGEDASISDEALDVAESNLPAFIVAINMELLRMQAEQGKIKRFKGDKLEEINEVLGYAFVVTMGDYLMNKGMSRNEAADKAEKLGMDALSYIESAYERLDRNPLVKDVFFEMCNEYQKRVMGDFDKSKIGNSFVIFDFAKQLYRNIESSSKKIKVD